MPLRDHFRPPLADRTSWDGFHGQWPAMIVMALFRQLPPRYVAAPNIHLGSSIEIDVGAFEEDVGGTPSTGRPAGNGTGANVPWVAPAPSLAIATDLPDQDEYEVRVFDTRGGRRLVAAIEIVSPSNKDRPEHRRAFVAKCASLLRDGVCVAIVDLVTTRSANFYADLLEFHGRAGPPFSGGLPPLYAVACRRTRKGETRVLETWAHPLTLGEPLPTLPLWIAADVAVPLELEPCYEETCRVLRIP